MLPKDEVLRIAELAKLKISEKDVEGYRKDLSAILDFVGEIQKLPALEHAEHEQIMGRENVFRKDGEGGVPKEKGQELAREAPSTKDGFVVVPRILPAEGGSTSGGKENDDA